VGLLSASHTVVRFIAPPPAHLDREHIATAVTKRAFRESEPGADDATASCGWVGVHDPLFVRFTPADLFFQHHLVVGFRYDRRAVPAKLLFLERRRAEAIRLAELGYERLPRVIRNEIKEEVQARLMLRALPAPRLFDCVWNLDSGRVYFTGKAKVVCEAFQDMFRETFGVQPIPMIPYLTAEYVGLSDRIVESVRGAEPSSLGSDEAPAPAHEGVPHLPLEEAVP
jgi:recombination associated protein RdgC